jgi:hypothetical protein
MLLFRLMGYDLERFRKSVLNGKYSMNMYLRIGISHIYRFFTCHPYGIFFGYNNVFSTNTLSYRDLDV